MTDLTIDLSSMSRPRVLVQAARFAAAATQRRRSRAAADARPPAWDKLIEEEGRLDAARRAGDAGYSPTRHVTVLTALLAGAGETGTAA
ncbi:hypothetical protein HKCCE2091_05290 [Rhodobacterales bacterium HKCCE2091]|nr:hypothetical protein [Rhodobacterales bacterium HKCCE2091]